MTTAEEYFYKGYKLYNEGEYEKAIESYTKVIQLQANNPELDAYFFRGRCYQEMGECEKAIKDFTNSIQINPEDSETYFHRANCYKTLQKYNEAINDYTHATNMLSFGDKNMLNVYCNRIDCYAALQDFEKVLSELEFLLSSKNSFEHSAFTEQRFYMIEQMYEDIKNHMDYDVDYDEDFDSECQEHFSKASILVSEGNIYEGIAEFYKAYVLDSEQTTIYLERILKCEDVPEKIKQFTMTVLKFCQEVELEFVNKSREEKFEYIKLFVKSKKQQKGFNMDFSQLNYNPTQGRKLDF